MGREKSGHIGDFNCFCSILFPQKVTKVGLGKCQDFTELAGEQIFTTIFYTVLYTKKCCLKIPEHSCGGEEKL